MSKPNFDFIVRHPDTDFGEGCTDFVIDGKVIDYDFSWASINLEDNYGFTNEEAVHYLSSLPEFYYGHGHPPYAE